MVKGSGGRASRRFRNDSTCFLGRSDGKFIPASSWLLANPESDSLILVRFGHVCIRCWVTWKAVYKEVFDKLWEEVNLK
jgi:hypothetical protein